MNSNLSEGEDFSLDCELKKLASNVSFENEILILLFKRSRTSRFRMKSLELCFMVSTLIAFRTVISKYMIQRQLSHKIKIGY